MDTVKISGMRCAHCTGAVMKALNDIDGISNINVSLENGEASFENSGVSHSKIKQVIEDIGFDVTGVE